MIVTGPRPSAMRNSTDGPICWSHRPSRWWPSTTMATPASRTHSSNLDPSSFAPSRRCDGHVTIMERRSVTVKFRSESQARATPSDRSRPCCAVLLHDFRPLVSAVTFSRYFRTLLSDVPFGRYVRAGDQLYRRVPPRRVRCQPLTLTPRKPILRHAY